MGWHVLEPGLLLHPGGMERTRDRALVSWTTAWGQFSGSCCSWYSSPQCFCDDLVRSCALEHMWFTGRAQGHHGEELCETLLCCIRFW